VLCTGARPLLFLDYVGCGRLDPERVAELVEGVADGCRQAGCALLGGETAEIPALYGERDVDLAGFCVGAVERARLVDGSRVAAGDVLVAIASDGVHSNGFSLVRRLLEHHGIDPRGAPDALLAPTAIYAREVAALLDAVDVRALAHVTGGGIEGNLPRVLPDGLGAAVDAGAWAWPEVFAWLAGLGVETDEMRRVFNCGVGMIAVVPAADADRALEAAAAGGRAAFPIGRVEPGAGVAYA
jgi:phosphoribosylformylglycinamidine cyclo-ligase